MVERFKPKVAEEIVELFAEREKVADGIVALSGIDLTELGIPDDAVAEVKIVGPLTDIRDNNRVVRNVVLTRQPLGDGVELVVSGEYPNSYARGDERLWNMAVTTSDGEPVFNGNNGFGPIPFEQVRKPDVELLSGVIDGIFKGDLRLGLQEH